MAQTTRACTECGAEVHRINPVGAIRGQCSDDCRRARHRRIRPEQPKTSKPCETCGLPVFKAAECPTFRKYCSENCRPACAVEGCLDPARTRGWCSNHYVRWRHTGDPLKTVPDTRPAPSNTLDCPIDGCGERQRKRGWCARHYAIWFKHGDPLAEVNSWSAREATCRMCNEPTAPHIRQYCSFACRESERRALRRGNPVPRQPIPCHRCGNPIPTIRRNGKALRRSDSLMCEACQRQRRPRHVVTADDLAAERGNVCGFCRKLVDMALCYPDPMSASVDHIVPRARGGQNVQANLQLCHFRCNATKKASLVA